MEGGIDQYLTSRPSVLISVRNACSYYVCMLPVVVIQLPTLTTKECHCTEYYGIRKLPVFSYHSWHWYQSHRVDESSNAFLCFITVSHEKHPWILLAIYFHKKKRNPKVMATPPTSGNILQHMLWAHLQIMLWKAAYCEGPAGELRDIANFGW